MRGARAEPGRSDLVVELHPEGVGRVVSVKVLTPDPDRVRLARLGLELALGEVVRGGERSFDTRDAGGIDAPLVARRDLIGLGRLGRLVVVRPFALGIADLERIRRHERRAG